MGTIKQKHKKIEINPELTSLPPLTSFGVCGLNSRVTDKVYTLCVGVTVRPTVKHFTEQL